MICVERDRVVVKLRCPVIPTNGQLCCILYIICSNMFLLGRTQLKHRMLYFACILSINYKFLPIVNVLFKLFFMKYSKVFKSIYHDPIMELTAEKLFKQMRLIYQNTCFQYFV